jgi:hypothetical protein
MSRIAISPTASEYQAAEAAVVTRLRESAPGIAIAQVGGAIAGLLVVFALFALTKAEYPASAQSNMSVLGTLGLLLLGVATYFVATAISKSRVARSLYAEDGKLLRPYTLEVSERAFVMESLGSRAEVAWSNVEEVVVTTEQAIVFTAPTHGVPIPRRCFASVHEFNAFVEAIRTLATAARNGA